MDLGHCIPTCSDMSLPQALSEDQTRINSWHQTPIPANMRAVKACSGAALFWVLSLYTVIHHRFLLIHIIYIFWGFLNRCKIITCAGGAWVIDTLHLHMHANYYLQIIGMNELYNIFMSSTNVVLPGALSVEAWWYGPDQVLFKGQGCWWNICSTIEGWIGLMWIQSSFKSTNSLATWNHTMLKCYACVVWGGSLCNSIRGEFRITTQHI